MNDSPRVVIRSKKREEVSPSNFNFNIDQVLLDNLPPGIRTYRSDAWQLFQKMPMPGNKDEAWRRTDISRLRLDQFVLPTNNYCLDLPPVPEALLKPLTGQEFSGQAVLLPGGCQVQLNDDLANKGVIFSDLKTAEKKYPEYLGQIQGKAVNPKEGKFAALTASFSQTGIFLYVPKGVKILNPIQTLLWAPGVNLAHLAHILVWLDEGSEATFVYETSSPDDNGDALYSGLVEIVTGANAKLRFVELQTFGRNMWNFSHERALVDRDASFDWIFGAVGSHLTKNFSEINLVGSGAAGKMSGFYFADGKQHLDHDTQQNHLAPNTTSDLLFKGALLDESRSVWQGMIYVAPGAIKTDGYQANRNLVLSKNARADSIPGLEILADDVRCTHGATVGKIDREQVFYLMARGIPRKEAERLIVEGFFDQIMLRIPFEEIRRRFQESIEKKMSSYLVG